MIASLPMYDFSEIRGATDRFWSLIRDRLQADGIDAPAALHRGDPWGDWNSADLVLSQTCGFPYRTALHDRVELVGTPDYGLPGAPPGYYFSQLVVRADRPGDWADFVTGRLALNGFDSQSGWAAPQNHAALSATRFTRFVKTGAHFNSVIAVCEGLADIAAIDAVTWRIIQRHRPHVAAQLRVVATTEPTPGLPLITAPGNDSDLLFGAISQAIAQLLPQDREDLGLRGVLRIAPDAYLAVPVPANMDS